ncbi:MAG TPA: TIGR00725 family protein [Actinomycetota bacterium]|nr:TIGR00725 family protein [Actinomycetota bacterium]
MSPRTYIAVVGGHHVDDATVRRAEEVGRAIAEAGAVLVCGGRGGVMEAACRGARSAGGTTLGILPGESREDANDHIDVAVATGLGEMRNMVVVHSADVVIALAGEYGTLSEIAFALRVGTPVVGIDTWELARRGQGVSDGIVRVDDPRAAVTEAMRLARR